MDKDMVKVYEVEILGNDYDFEEDDWTDVHEPYGQWLFDTYEEAVAFVKAITVEEAVYAEQATECNGLDIVIWERFMKDDEEVICDEDGNTLWSEVGSAEWIGDKCNGIWVWEVVK